MNVATRGTNSTLTKGNTNLITVNRIGNGLKFDGVNDYVSVGNPSQLQFSDSDSFTINGYISNLTSSYIYLFAYYYNNNYNGYFFATTNSAIYFKYGGNTGVSSRDISATFTTRNSCFFTVVKNGADANNFSLYIDGELMIKTVVSNFTPPVSYFTATATVGSLSFEGIVSPFVTGNLYDLKIFNKALSVGEVTQLYTSFNNNLTGLTANLVADYNFNQKSGTTLTDNSPNQLHGTLTNFGATSNLGGGAWVNSLGSTINF